MFAFSIDLLILILSLFVFFLNEAPKVTYMIIEYRLLLRPSLCNTMVNLCNLRYKELFLLVIFLIGSFFIFLVKLIVLSIHYNFN